MITAAPASPINIFSTCPQSRVFDRTDYLDAVLQVARWSDEASCAGMLIYTDNSLVDPWTVAQLVLGSTTQLRPLIAVQPVYMHPYAVAKLVASYGLLFGRQVFLNMVAGGFTRDLQALDDDTEHDARYDRLVEYTTIVKRLLSGQSVTFSGRYYRVTNLRLAPSLPPELMPGITVSGSSIAGAAAAEALDATAVQYPRPAGEYEGGHERTMRDPGIRIGIIAREDADAAWRVAWDRFPPDRQGQLTHQLAMKLSDSVWHRQLSSLALRSEAQAPAYWLHPFENYKTFCPYLVGDYATVGAELARYLEIGFRTFIMDIPREPDDLTHIGVAFHRATSLAFV